MTPTMIPPPSLTSPAPPPHHTNPSPSTPGAGAQPLAALQPLARVRVSDIDPYEGAETVAYSRAVEALSVSLTRHNAVVIELGSEDAVIMRCGLDAARMYFRMTATRWQGQSWKGSTAAARGVYVYRAGRAMEDMDSSPPCMAEIFKCMGKAARATLCAIARHLRLRSDVFVHLLDDMPLPANEESSSMLIASHVPTSLKNGSDAIGGGKPAINGEVEKGLLTLISADVPGLQVCDPNGHWYLADGSSSPGDLLLVTGKALSHATAGLRPAPLYRVAPDYPSNCIGNGRTSLTFRLIPQGKAMLDCSPIAAAGHVISQSYVPVSVSQFMDDLSAEEDILCHPSNTVCAFVDRIVWKFLLPFLDEEHLDRIVIISEAVAASRETSERTLRSVLSDPLSGAFLEDATVVSCGHSFGGFMLKKVVETSRCTVCGAEIKASRLIPNHALRAAALAVKHEDDRRLFHNVALRKKRKEMGDQIDNVRKVNKDNGDTVTEDCLHKGVQYPFTVNEKVLIKGNKRTPEKFVGKEAVVTSQCLNGWYLLKIIGSGENVRLQYRSLEKIINSEITDNRCISHSVPNGGS